MVLEQVFGEAERPAVGTPDWWLHRLSHALDERNAATSAMQKADRYYRGEQPLAFASEKFREAFGGRFPEFSSNFCALVVDAHRDRLAVQGIRYDPDDREGDADAWEWWQRNHLDAESDKLHTEALVKGEAAVIVWPGPDGEPLASVEDPLQVIVETTPGRAWQRRAALKRYTGDDGRLRAELYLPGLVYRYRSRQAEGDFSLPVSWWSPLARWEPDPRAGEAWPIVHGMGVPVVPIMNRPRLRQHDIESELAPILSNQDAINKLRMDALVSAEFASFRQRWAIGLDIPVDEATGAPIEPFRTAVDRLWVVPGPSDEDLEAYREAGFQSPPDVRFGEFAQTDVSGILKQIESEIQAMSSISRTPMHYLLNVTQLPSGETLKAAETPLVQKVRHSQLHKGDGWEAVFQLMFAWRGDPRGDVAGAELIWRNPESRSESVMADAISKQVAMGLPFEVALEQLGYSPSQIARILAIREQEQLAADARALAAAGPELGTEPAVPPAQAGAQAAPGSIGVSGAITS